MVLTQIQATPGSNSSHERFLPEKSHRDIPSIMLLDISLPKLHEMPAL